MLSGTAHFMLTNFLPRRSATRFVGWLSKREHPLVRDASMAVWRYFEDIDLSDAATQEFASLHACFTRALRPGARPVDASPEVMVSPCDAVLVAAGAIVGGTLVQAKGSTYTLTELLLDPAYARAFEGGMYATLRLTSAMYHRFHAPCDARIESLHYVSGDTWNTHPHTLARVRKLYCRNERAILRMVRTPDELPFALVPVASILVASMRFHCIDVRQTVRSRGAYHVEVGAACTRGEELGWFEHGSTIVVLVPRGVRLAPDLTVGAQIRMGRPLFHIARA